jgi:hypothetical protein
MLINTQQPVSTRNTAESEFEDVELLSLNNHSVARRNWLLRVYEHGSASCPSIIMSPCSACGWPEWEEKNLLS